MGRNGGGISADMVPRRGPYRYHAKIFASEFERIGDRLRVGFAFGDLVGHSPVPPPPFGYCHYECIDGPAACRGGVNCLFAPVARGPIWCVGTAVYTRRHDHRTGDYHYASDCLHYPPSHARALVGLS